MELVDSFNDRLDDTLSEWWASKTDAELGDLTSDVLQDPTQKPFDQLTPEEKIEIEESLENQENLENNENNEINPNKTKAIQFSYNIDKIVSNSMFSSIYQVLFFFLKI